MVVAYLLLFIWNNFQLCLGLILYFNTLLLWLLFLDMPVHKLSEPSTGHQILPGSIIQHIPLVLILTASSPVFFRIIEIIFRFSRSIFQTCINWQLPLFSLAFSTLALLYFRFLPYLAFIYSRMLDEMAVRWLWRGDINCKDLNGKSILNNIVSLNQTDNMNPILFLGIMI